MKALISEKVTGNTDDLDAVLQVALAAAHSAGAILMDKFRRLERVEKKGAVDLVTEADLASEREIVSAIRRDFPGHSIVAEEGDYAGFPSPHRWSLRPIA